MENDVLKKLGKSKIQHGKLNDRIYLMKLAPEDFPGIVDALNDLASAKNYSKIFAKVPAYAKDTFASSGYAVEAYIPGFFNGNEDVYFMGRYISPERQNIVNDDQLDDIIRLAKFKSRPRVGVGLAPGYTCKMLGMADVGQMAEVYGKVFKTYPFPIHNPSYLAQTMKENVIYFGICSDNKILALSSSEIDAGSLNVEMTDFATLPEFRGKGFAEILLLKMEEEMRKQGIKTAYTIARAASSGINIIFARAGYCFCGLLANNTNISGNLESMNVWYKSLN